MGNPRKTSYMTNLKNLKIWGGNKDIIFQIEDEALRIIDAKEIEFFEAKPQKKKTSNFYEVFANPSIAQFSL